MNKYKVLVIEDESMVFLTEKMYLNKLGFTSIVNIPNGEEAIEYVKNNKPDIIIMDILLSGKIDGIETAEIILSENKIPIIFLSGYSKKDYSERLGKIDLIDFLTKPVTINRLKESIRKAVIAIETQLNYDDILIKKI